MDISDNKKRRKVVSFEKNKLGKKKLKRVLLMALSSLLVLNIGVESLIDLFKPKKEILENQFGTENVLEIFTGDVDSKEFAVLNAGNHNTKGDLFFENIAKHCNEEGISVAIYIDTKAESEEQIYHDVNLVREIIKNNTIDLPVYLNIDHIIENTRLTPNIKKVLIRDFLEKCQSNNIYVGVRGKDSNLCLMKEYCGIKEFDAYVLMEGDSIKYDGTYNMYRDLNGRVCCTYDGDLSKLIIEKGLNNKNKLVDDKVHIVKEGESILEISFENNISVDELCSYNSIGKFLKPEDIVPGTKLLIPTKIQPTTIIKTFIDGKSRVVDISENQGADINWTLLRENFDQIIIKTGWGRNEDTCAKSNLVNAKKHGFDEIGVYSYLSARRSYTPTDEEYRKFVEASADKTLEIIKNHDIQLPIYLDIEPTENEKYITNAYTKEDIKIALDVWYSKITEAGYIPGIYANETDFSYIVSSVDYDITEKFSIWYAGGNKYNMEIDKESYKNLENSLPGSSVIPGEEIDIYQQSKKGMEKYFGAGNKDGYLDIGYSYIEVEEVIANMTEEEKKEFDRWFNSEHWSVFGKTIIALLMIGVSIFSINKIINVIPYTNESKRTKL